ncbi:MAG: DnaA ATPase domain-containing protein, partial [Thermoplasmatota archaeon]
EISPERPSRIPDNIDDEFPTRYSFERFVVGPNNRFAYAAALAVSENPEKSYNPLLIKAESGLGKTHLMKAIGRALSKRFPGRKIKYVETSKLISDFDKHMEKDGPEKFEKIYVNCDTLLLDDIQYIAERLDVQHSLFHIFNQVQNKKGQIVISSDRPPERITEIEERLASRFKSGLVVDILPPTYETRKQIIKEKSNQFHFKISQDVLDFIAKNIQKNVRFIEGALTRVSAYSDLLDEEVTLESVKKTLEQYIDEEIGHKELRLDVIGGRSYLVKGESVENLFELLKKIDNENERFVISRLNPRRIKDEFELEDSEVKWLTDKESEKYDTISPNLERLSWLLEKKSKKDSVILLDGLEYLISNVNFEASLKFIRHMVDIVSETESIFLMIVNPNALEEKEISILEREMDTYVS